MSVLMRKPETLVDVYRLLPEGTPIQVIQNQFYMSPSPTFDHFSIAKKIFIDLNAHVTQNKLDEVVYAPVDVFLGDRNAVQPDVFFISKENNHFIKKDGIYGALLQKCFRLQIKILTLLKRKLFTNNLV